MGGWLDGWVDSRKDSSPECTPVKANRFVCGGKDRDKCVGEVRPESRDNQDTNIITKTKKNQT